MTGPGSADVLSSGPAPLSPIRRRHLLMLLAAGLLVVAVTTVLDHRHRSQEFRALLGCVRSGEAVEADAEQRVTAMSSYVRPSVESGPSMQVQRGLYTLVAAQAAAGEPAVRAAAGRCRTVAILPFDRRLRAARRSYLFSLLARDAHLRATAADGSQAFTDRQDLAVLRARALTALAATTGGEPGRRALARAWSGR